jgi:hypothetical protein
VIDAGLLSTRTAGPASTLRGRVATGHDRDRKKRKQERHMNRVRALRILRLREIPVPQA